MKESSIEMFINASQSDNPLIAAFAKDYIKAHFRDAIKYPVTRSLEDWDSVYTRWCDNGTILPFKEPELLAEEVGDYIMPLSSKIKPNPYIIHG